MSRLNIKTSAQESAPVTLLHEAKKGSVFMFKAAYDRYGREAEPHMRVDQSITDGWGEAYKAKSVCISLNDGCVLVRPRTTEIVQVNADLVIGTVHGAER